MPIVLEEAKEERGLTRFMETKAVKRVRSRSFVEFGQLIYTTLRKPLRVAPVVRKVSVLEPDVLAVLGPRDIAAEFLRLRYEPLARRDADWSQLGLSDCLGQPLAEIVQWLGFPRTVISELRKSELRHK